MFATRTMTLADAALPGTGAVRQVALIAGASVLTALAARIAIPLPWSPVPLTGQTFAVLLTGAVLGARRGCAAQALYLAQGAAGLPVFAGGVAGLAAFMGPTAGYLLAFPFAAALTGHLAERGWDRSFLATLTAMLLGSGVILALGTAGLARFAPPGTLLAQGMLPFLPGDLAKSAVAACAFPAVWRWVGRSGA
jgi:biotin transport system substrate-specific component